MQNASDTQTPAATPPSREHIHSRNIAANAYLRSDGLWDIECELTDTKSYAFENADGKKLEAGQPVHRLWIRLAVDDQLFVREATATMPDTPFPECTKATAPFTRLIGLRIATGWRRAIEESMGGVEGCTHLREMLGLLGTVALQATNGYRKQQLRQAGKPIVPTDKPGYQMGKCVGWDFNGPVVARIAPQFIGYAGDLLRGGQRKLP
ncbi:DUF2889 domain-containing protein [Bordetella sp. N]|uniref:DUF2889 domain-containing protein n=1 Tax=Bordetella sp. N TaxID=1746199 RepID=UPI000710B39D|nr:DUF2889 domain-containing protein [Bordetella sp. N]ALM83595.1 hypothetical protein ASB57_11995 [Bordetella sp. N]